MLKYTLNVLGPEIQPVTTLFTEPSSLICILIVIVPVRATHFLCKQECMNLSSSPLI
jgi:hypothetical protein